MPDHAQPTWNRHLLPIDEAHKILDKATFRLQLPDNRRGTGFFISKDGWALTADHNLRKPESRRVTFFAYYKGKRLKFRYHKDSSSKHADIALMKIETGKQTAEPRGNSGPGSWSAFWGICLSRRRRGIRVRSTVCVSARTAPSWRAGHLMGR